MDGPTICCKPVSGSIFANSWALLTRTSDNRNRAPKTDSDATNWFACEVAIGVPWLVPKPMRGVIGVKRLARAEG